MKYPFKLVSFFIITVFLSVKDLSLHAFPTNTLERDMLFFTPGESPDLHIRVGYLSLKPYSESGPEIQAAYNFLKENEKVRYEFITFPELKKHPSILKNFDMIWYHRPDTTFFTDTEIDPKTLRFIREYLENGGSLLLTLDAFRYIVPLGLETIEPKDSLKSCIDEGYGRNSDFILSAIILFSQVLMVALMYFLRPGIPGQGSQVTLGKLDRLREKSLPLTGIIFFSVKVLKWFWNILSVRARLLLPEDIPGIRFPITTALTSNYLQEMYSGT